jgi:signal transduction histidine kinase
MSVAVASPLVTRFPSRVRTVLAWTGLVLSPVLLDAWIFARNPMAGPSFGLGYVVPILAMVLPVGALRRRPLVTLTVVVLNMVAMEFAYNPHFLEDLAFRSDLRAIQTVAIDAAVGYVAATRRRWVSVPTAVGVFVIQAMLAAALPIGPLEGAVTQDLLAVLSAWVIGNTIRQRRQFAEARRIESANRAVQEERLRIARELHDMIAHSLGVIAIQAGMGRRVVATQPEQAGRALAAIEDTGRDTLAALRRMVGTLRRAETQPGSAPLDPTPGLADLDDLVGRTRDAGVDVVVRRDGEQRPLPPDIDLSAYRIIQEAVTNVVRHAHTRRCEVVVTQRSNELSIEVTDDGKGGAVGAGYGIAGMRERVSLLGGDFDAGPRPEGGFRVNARLPVPDGTR